MKINLPENLRILFDVMRGITILSGIYLVAASTFNPWIQRNFVIAPQAPVEVGVVGLKFAQGPIELSTTDGNKGDLVLRNLRGPLVVNYASKDRALINRIRWVAIPTQILACALSYLLFTTLGQVCANIETREIFSDKNFLLLRRTGFLLLGMGVLKIISYSAGASVIGFFLSQHVSVSGLSPGLGATVDWPDMGASMLGERLLAYFATGGCVLLIAEAFRHGIALKVESELTV